MKKKHNTDFKNATAIVNRGAILQTKIQKLVIHRRGIPFYTTHFWCKLVWLNRCVPTWSLYFYSWALFPMEMNILEADLRSAWLLCPSGRCRDDGDSLISWGLLILSYPKFDITMLTDRFEKQTRRNGKLTSCVAGIAQSNWFDVNVKVAWNGISLITRHNSKKKWLKMLPIIFATKFLFHIP